MASYFNLTVDTTAPKGVTLTINDGAIKTTSTTLNLEIGCDDVGNGTQMKIWNNVYTTEAAATWEEFDTIKTILLDIENFGPDHPMNPTITFYVKVRDDVWNESAAASATIQYINAVPTVNVISVSRSKISNVSGKNNTTIEFNSTMPFSEYKICSVPSLNSSYSTGTVLESGNVATNTLEQTVTLYRNSDEYNPVNNLADGTHIIKVFVKESENGLWSV